MEETKRFELRVLLTVTTGRLLTKSPCPGDNGISALYDLLGWMTNDSPYTHQLPSFADECKPWLFRWWPELTGVNEMLPLLEAAIENYGPEKGCEYWLGTLELSAGMKREYDVPRIPRDDHTQRDPLDELVGMVGAGKVIVIKP